MEIDTKDGKLKLSAPMWKKMRTMTAKLASGSSHGVLLAQATDNDSSMLLLDATPDNIFRMVYEAFPVCAIPEWSDWLIVRLEEEGYLRMLTSYNIKAAILKVTEKALDEIVSDGVSRNRISFKHFKKGESL